MAEDLPRHVIRDAARLTAKGMTLGLAAWAATAGAREIMKRRAEEAIALASEGAISRLRPETPPHAAPEPPLEIDLRTPKVPEPSPPLDVETDLDSPPAPPKPVKRVPKPKPAPPVEIEPEATAEPEPPADLPVADFDTITVPSLRARFRRLDLADLQTLRAHELAHGNRSDILSLLDNRIAKLTSEA